MTFSQIYELQNDMTSMDKLNLNTTNNVVHTKFPSGS